MNEEMEDLLPILAKLTDKYTSKESSSVTYETAKSLMEAIMYCIQEFYDKSAQLYGDIPSLNGDGDKEKIYNQGYEYILEKVHAAKAIYENMIHSFEDYGCKNYHDTIIKGMPAFFVKYDVKFRPQDHLLTLDYPVMFPDHKKCGVNLIYDYLQGIQTEKKLLDVFDRKVIVSLLSRVNKEYESLYLGNICDCVLITAVGCAIIDAPIQNLRITPDACKEIYWYFSGDSRERIETKITKLIHLIVSNLHDLNAEQYFIRAGADYAFRVHHAIQYRTLENVFLAQEQM